MNQTTYARGSDATDSDPPHHPAVDVLTAAVDWLVASAGLVLLGLGAFWMFAGRPDSLPWLLVGGLLLVADAGVTTRLRVDRLEAQMCDDYDAVSPR